MRRDATSALLAALKQRLGDVHPDYERIDSRDWASATFAGTRHDLSLRLPKAAAQAFLLGIEEADFTLRGHILADIAVLERAMLEGGMERVRIEALTVEDA